MDLLQLTSQLDAETPYQPSAKYFSWEYRLQLIGLFAGFYAAVFIFSHILSTVLLRCYNSLQAKNKVLWNLCIVRAVNSSLCVVVGLQCLTSDSLVFRDKITGQEDWSWFQLLRVTGFFVYDNVALQAYSLMFQAFDLSLSTHHVFSLLICLGAVACNSLGHFLAIITPLLEVSSVFKNLSWLLRKAGWGQTKFWRANQWMIIHMYHCRMVVIYYIIYFFLVHWGELMSHITLVPQILFVTGMGLLIFILNPNWTHHFTISYVKSVPQDCNRPVESSNNRHAVKPHAR